MKKSKMFIRIITASLMRRKSRMLVALLATAIGATVLSGLITVYQDVPRQMGAQFRNYGANVLLTPENTSFTKEEFGDSVAQIRAEDLVGATPYRYHTVRIHEQPIQAGGTYFESLQKTSPYWSVEGEWPLTGKQILVGMTVADDLQLSVGESVTISFTPEDINMPDTMIDFTVAGLVSTGGKEENYIYMGMEDMLALVQEEEVYDLAELSISANTEKLNTYADTIQESTGNVKASLIKRVTASEATVLSKLQALVLLVTVIVLALTMICVTTTMTAVVSERRKEIGLRKAIGASDRSIFIEFMGEGVILGACGGIAGAFLGFLFADFVSANVFNSSITLKPALVPITMLATILVTALACIMPIQSATRIDPALVLKGE